MSKTTKLADELKDHDQAVVLFYAAWCPFSRRFLPQFQDFAKTHPDLCRTVEVGEDPDACEAFDIDVYPSVLIFKNGRVEKRLDGIPGVGLNKSQLETFCKKP